MDFFLTELVPHNQPMVLQKQSVRGWMSVVIVALNDICVFFSTCF